MKQAFDPGTLFNPHRIVDPPRMDDRRLFRYGPGYAPAEGFSPVLDWSSHPGPLGGLLGAVEMCNNNGACRAFDAGVMCPSFRATREEKHLTRGRANTLRLALTGQLGPDAMASDALAEAMALCVSCKACRRECPTGVDMARMKIEVLAARVARKGAGRRRAPDRLPAPLCADRRTARPAGQPPQPFFFRCPARRAVSRDRRTAKAARIPPRFLPRRGGARRAGGGQRNAPRGEVLLLADTFNRYFEPENLRAALHVLAAAGYRAIVPAAPGRPLCCGRTYLAAGLVGRAREEAGRLLRACAGERPVIGLEPSCLLTLRDEIPALIPGPEARALAERAMLIGEFLAREKPPLPLAPRAGTVHVHGHCHQKAFGAFPATLAALQRIPGLEVRPIAATCCGMAGAFGYQAETEPVSRAIAEAGLLPALASAGAEDLIVADGTSCRHQIADLAGRRALHSVRLLAEQLEDFTGR